MVRTEISLFMKNVPGELGKLARLFGNEGINIDALTIQDASSYVQDLFKARGRSLKRIASVASYNSMRKDSVEFALIRLLVDQTDKAVDLLSKNEYIFDVMPVIAIDLIDLIWTHEVDQNRDYMLKAGDAWGDADITNIS